MTDPIEILEKNSLDEFKAANRELLYTAQQKLHAAILQDQLDPKDLIRALEVLHKIEVPDPKLVNQINIKVPSLFADSQEAQDAILNLTTPNASKE